MIAGRVKTQQEVEDELKAQGFEPTEHRTATGRIWRSTKTGRYMQAPDPYMEMYPEFILKDLREIMEGFGPTLH